MVRPVSGLAAVPTPPPGIPFAVYHGDSMPDEPDPTTVSSETIVLLQGMSQGERPAADRLMERLYDTLLSIAEQRLRGDPLARSLEPAAIVSEVYLRLIGGAPIQWQDRVHFLAVSSRMIRRVLIDIAKARKAAKRGGAWERLTLSGVAVTQDETQAVDMELLERALARLTELDQRQAKIVELRFYAGMTEEEVAEALSISRRSVQLDWAHAKAWLRRELDRDSTAFPP